MGMIKIQTRSPAWIAIGYLGMAVIVTLSLVPAALRPHTGAGGGYEHGLAYALVGFAFGLGYARPRDRLISGLALMATAATLELLQNVVPGRTPEVTGFLTSSFGAWLGLFAATLASAVVRAKEN